MQAPDAASFRNFTATEGRRLVTVDRRTTVFPKRPSQPQLCKLSASDLQLLGCNYNQKGLLFEMPPSHNFESILNLLKSSLSEILVYFYPLAGRLITSEEDGVVYLDCNDAGVDFIEASTCEDVSLAQLETEDGTPVVRQLFALDGAVNLDGHFLPLLTVQVTKLRDGVGIGLTLNHSVADGASFWHFVNSWAQLCRGSPSLTVHPIHDRSMGRNSVIKLRIADHDIERFSPPLLREKIFHFTKETISKLKDRANEDAKQKQLVSSFQSLCGHLWQAVTRARGVPLNEETSFRLSVNCRPRLEPALPPSYFGNAIQTIYATTTAGELLTNDLSFAAGLLHKIIEAHRDVNIRKAFNRWEKSPIFYKLSQFGPNDLLMGSSPRFAMYDSDFGWGKPVAVRSGCANKFDGKITAYPGKGEEGSVDLEVCLLPQFMNALETDSQLIDKISCMPH